MSTWARLRIALAFGVAVTVGIGIGVAAVSPWPILDHEFESWDPPYSFRSLGPVLALRHYLAEKQWTSLNAPPDPARPVLVRFEILDIVSHDFHITHVGELVRAPNFDALSWRGFAVQANLYWVSLQPAAPQHFGAVRVFGYSQDKERTHPTEGVRYDGPVPTSIRVERAHYVVIPQGVRTSRPVTVRYGQAKEAVLGTQGWIVDEEQTRRGTIREVTLDGKSQRFLPLRDPTAEWIAQMLGTPWPNP